MNTIIGTDPIRQRQEERLQHRLESHISALSAAAGLPHVAWRALVTIDDDGTVTETVCGELDASYGRSDVYDAIAAYAHAWGTGIVLSDTYPTGQSTATAMVTIAGHTARVYGVAEAAVAA